MEVDQDEHGQREGSGHQQDGLDDLDPGGGAHAAEGHVDHHQRADPDHGPGPGRVARAAEQQRHQAARADHLGDQVQHGDGDGRGADGGTHRALRHPCGDHVGQREPAAVADEFGDEQQNDQPGDEEADGVEHAVVAEEGDQPGDAEEGGRRHVVAGDGESVLHGREEASAENSSAEPCRWRPTQVVMKSVTAMNALNSSRARVWSSQPLLPGRGQDAVQHPPPGIRLRQPVPELRQHREVEPRITQLQPERVLEVDPRPHRLRRLPVGEPLHELQHQHERQPPR
ncbi:hypothetical protein SBADM41S_07501 [Streptomyces badius]